MSKPETEPSRQFSVAEMEAIIEQTFDNLGLFVRDAELSPEITAKYEPGLIFREKGLTYATYRVGGLAANCRFAIFSNHMTKKTPDPENYGLCFAEKGSVFKVLGRHDYDGGSWIVLLHLPGGEYWKAFVGFNSPVEADMVKSCVDWLETMTKNPVIPELLKEEWVDSCKYPVGVDDSGAFFPL